MVLQFELVVVSIKRYFQNYDSCTGKSLRICQQDIVNYKSAQNSTILKIENSRFAFVAVK